MKWKNEQSPYNQVFRNVLVTNEPSGQYAIFHGGAKYRRITNTTTVHARPCDYFRSFTKALKPLLTLFSRCWRTFKREDLYGRFGDWKPYVCQRRKHMIQILPCQTHLQLYCEFRMSCTTGVHISLQHLPCNVVFILVVRAKYCKNPTSNTFSP